MANSLDAGKKEIWDNRYQITHQKSAVYRGISNFSLEPKLKKGDTAHRIYGSDPTINDTGSDGSYSVQDITDTDESLSIDQDKESSFYIDELDEMQNHLPTLDHYAMLTSAKLVQEVDAQILGEYDQLSLSVDDSDLGGTSGNGITVTTSNVYKLFTLAQTKLIRNNTLKPNNMTRFSNVRAKDLGARYLFAVITPDIHRMLLEYVGGKESVFGDKVSHEAHIGRFMGFELLLSNQVGWSADLSLATDPTDGDTITINGTTLTFKATLGTTEGNVHICSSAANTVTNLANALNAPTTDIAEAADTGFVGFTANSSDHNNLKGLTASAATTTLSIKMTGRGFVTVSETLTDATDTWTAAKQIQHPIFGIRGYVDAVVQKNPTQIIDRADGKFGHNVATRVVFGKKVYNEGKTMAATVEVRTDQYS